ncbi:hypothetical protein F5B19DRAFT_495200 [Rostrohypoxylon terebratum]|nr:hypothetical protein F5B19DRAFT_495200 [Rostrohypoxylon terebratum]
MESMTIQRKATLESSFPLRTLQPQSSQLNFGRLPSPFGHKGADGAIQRTPIPEPPYSPISNSSRASFSQASCADSWEVISTAPSSPETPHSKYEFDDIPIKLESIPCHRDNLKHRRDSLGESFKKLKIPPVELPSLNRLLPPTNHDNNRHSFHPSARALKQHRPGPAPKIEYTPPSRHSYSPSDDPIVQCLNLWRKESGDAKGLLSKPRNREGTSLLQIGLDFRKPTSVLYDEKQEYIAEAHNYCQQSCPQVCSDTEEREPQDDSDDPDDLKEKIPHNNTKYSLEEMDYIRFNRYEEKLSWEEGKDRFRIKFPAANKRMNRARQGIQGVHYRDNKHVPYLVDRGRTLVFLENGHVKSIEAKVRHQKDDRPYFSLTYLYPERALLYDWVPEKTKQAAALLAKERAAQREAKKRETMRTGKWREVDDTGECACCPKPDRKRDEAKRSTPKRLGGSRFSRPTQTRSRRRLFDLAQNGMGLSLYTRQHIYDEARRRGFESQNI